MTTQGLKLPQQMFKVSVRVNKDALARAAEEAVETALLGQVQRCIRDTARDVLNAYVAEYMSKHLDARLKARMQALAEAAVELHAVEAIDQILDKDFKTVEEIENRLHKKGKK